MREFRPKLGVWNRRRSGKTTKLHVVNWVCPDTGRKRRKSFQNKAAAETYLQRLLAEIATQQYFNPQTNPTVAQLVEHWRLHKQGEVKAQTMKGYAPLLKIIVGPILLGTPQERAHHEMTGKKPRRDAMLMEMLGSYNVSELTTAQLRRWHNTVRKEVGGHTANRVMTMMRSLLALAEEDFNIRTCKTPTNLTKRKPKPKKRILAAEDVGKLLEHAKTDKQKGIYYAFPFLTGVRVAEQLGLLWDCVDLENDIIRIRRVQERDGTMCGSPKTESGRRDIPVSKTLRKLLLEWRLLCPRLDGKLCRVFPGPGIVRAWPQPRTGGGGPLLYANYTKRYWKPVFEEIGIPYVTHHSARHAFISHLQAQGVEVGLVAKIVGHANPMVTLGHYTQAVRGGQDAIAKLDEAYKQPA